MVLGDSNDSLEINQILSNLVLNESYCPCLNDGQHGKSLLSRAKPREPSDGSVLSKRVLFKGVPMRITLRDTSQWIQHIKVPSFYLT